MFAICIENSDAVDRIDDVSSGAVGRITIGDFAESFEMPLGFWDESDYRRSWCQAFKVLSEREDSVSCLMASMTDPATTNFLFCWPLYRIDDTVYIQNSILFLDEIGSSFDPLKPWLSIGPRCTVDDDGNRISEWATSMDSVAEFFRSNCS